MTCSQVVRVTSVVYLAFDSVAKVYFFRLGVACFLVNEIALLRLWPEDSICHAHSRTSVITLADTAALGQALHLPQQARASQTCLVSIVAIRDAILVRVEHLASDAAAFARERKALGHSRRLYEVSRRLDALQVTENHVVWMQHISLARAHAGARVDAELDVHHALALAAKHVLRHALS